MPTCTLCKQEKILSEFYKDAKSKLGYRYDCKVCADVRNRKRKLERLAEDPSYKVELRKSRRAEYLRKEYGITQVEYMKRVADQDFKCAICGTELHVRGTGTHLDHDHNTGLIRGMLCGNCNKGLGNFMDNIDILNSAIKYINLYEEARNGG